MKTNMKKICSFAAALVLALTMAGCAGTASQSAGTSSGKTTSGMESTVSKAPDAKDTGSTESTASEAGSTGSAVEDSSSSAASGDTGKAESTATDQSTTEPSEPTAAPEADETDVLSREGYTLEKVVVLSRHNIRAPMSTKGSALDTLTPYDWFPWSSNASQLSVRGGVLETAMGQYFRKWLEKEKLFPENYQPEAGDVRFYANAKQRTIATANFFKSGLLPVGEIWVETQAEYDTMDPIFTPQLTFVTDEYRKAMSAQMHEMFDEEIAGLSENYALLSEVLNVEESEDWKSGKFTGFKTDDTEFVLEEGKEPSINGSLKTACSLSDALVLQYFEADAAQAAFGRELTEEQWESISKIKDVYGDVLFTAPLVAAHVANPLLREITSELENSDRAFTFLCGHDSNISSVLAALSVEDYEHPGTLEKTPIGGKVVIGRWADADGKEYISVDLVYQTTPQLQGVSLLDLNNPPAAVHLAFAGLSANADGLYTLEAFDGRLWEAINKYEELIDTYLMANAA